MIMIRNQDSIKTTFKYMEFALQEVRISDSKLLDQVEVEQPVLYALN